jgi:putative nucleotidyltransferase with HDIG domain
MKKVRWNVLWRWTVQNYRSFLTLFFLSIGVGLLSQGYRGQVIPLLQEGDVSPRDIKASDSLRILDSVQTERRRESVANAIPPVYDFDSGLLPAVQERLSDMQSLLTQPRTGVDPQADAQNLLRIEMTQEEWNVLRNAQALGHLVQGWKRFVQSNPRPWIFRELPQDAITLRDITSGQETVISRNAIESQGRVLSAVRAELASFIPESTFKTRLLLIASKLLIENASLNPVESAARKSDAIALIEPIYLEAKQGEMIVREGQRIERRHLELLKAQQESMKSGFSLREALSFAAMFGLLTLVLLFAGNRNFKKFKLSFRDQWVMSSFLLASLAFLTGFHSLFSNAQDDLPIAGLFLFLLPVGFVGMTLRLFASMEITTFCIILQSFALAWIFQNPFFGIIVLAAGMAGAARMRRISERRDVFRAGLISGLVMAAFGASGLVLGLVTAPGLDSVWIVFMCTIGFSLAAGIIAAGLVLPIQPLLENLGYTTDLRLMELSRTDHPLLQDLILKAPGTYFHSFTVSQLAEKAADAVHANGLFARVAALYHDVGKTKKPQYFIENIKGDNKHDKLAPTMSSLIISNHVRDGIELAMEHKLPLSIIEVIPQHHGTSLIAYFYDRAKKMSGEEPVNEADFRYPGPKPQTKEAAIIMMADAVEATAKSMSQGTEDQLRQMVHQTIQRFFLDGQLDECELTLKDLSSISTAFLQVLQGVYHHRIDYPKDDRDQTITLPKLKTNSPS